MYADVCVRTFDGFGSVEPESHSLTNCRGEYLKICAEEAALS